MKKLIKKISFLTYLSISVLLLTSCTSHPTEESSAEAFRDDIETTTAHNQEETSVSNHNDTPLTGVTEEASKEETSAEDTSTEETTESVKSISLDKTPEEESMEEVITSFVQGLEEKIIKESSSEEDPSIDYENEPYGPIKVKIIYSNETQRQKQRRMDNKASFLIKFTLKNNVEADFPSSTKGQRPDLSSGDTCIEYTYDDPNMKKYVNVDGKYERAYYSVDLPTELIWEYNVSASQALDGVEGEQYFNEITYYFDSNNQSEEIPEEESSAWEIFPRPDIEEIEMYSEEEWEERLTSEEDIEAINLLREFLYNENLISENASTKEILRVTANLPEGTYIKLEQYILDYYLQ